LPVLSALAALAIAAPAAFAPSATAGAVGRHSPAIMFTMTITEIDRNTTTIGSPNASVYGYNGVSYLSGGGTVQVPAGTYAVAAPVWQPSDGDTQTLVAKKVHVTHNTNVTLSAVGAVPLSASLSGASGLPQQGD